MGVRNILLILSLLLPALGGALLLIHPIKDELNRRIFSEIFTVAASVCVWTLLAGGDLPEMTVYSFAGLFSVGLHVDGLSVVFAGMVSFMWPLVTLYAFDYMEHAHHKNAFFGFYMITYAITLGIAFSANIVTLYAFFEMLTIVTIALVSHYETHDSMYAGRIYANYTIGGASAGFIAVVITTMRMGGSFAAHGSNFTGFNKDVMLLVFLLGFFGFGTKAAVFPLYAWLPAASVAPTPVTALLHAVAVVNSGVFSVMRLTYYIYGADYIRGTWAQNIALGAAVFTIVFGAVCALRERHFKRRLAFSTVSNLSYMLFGVMLLTPDGFTGGLAHMLFHGFMKISLFLCAGAFMHVTGHHYIYEINGVGKRMPYTFTLYTLSALALVGLPLFSGFVSKWQLLTAAAEAATPLSYAGMAALITAAFLCAIYTLSVSIRAFFPMKGTDRYAESDVKEADWRMVVPIGIFTVISTAIGIHPQPVMSFLRNIVTTVMAG